MHPPPGAKDDRASRRDPGLSLESLSDRELEIFKLIGEGQSTSEMAVTFI